MGERLVDVSDINKRVLHTFPIEVEEKLRNSEVVYQEKALLAASYAQLVVNPETLTARMHISRGGQLTPYGDERGIHCETKTSLEQLVRERAYFLWQQEGSLPGHATEYWHRAHEQTIRERAYILWQQEGGPKGRADEFWCKTCEFEKY